MRAAAVDASVLIETCASMLETVVHARERMCYHLCQRAAVVDAHERVYYSVYYHWRRHPCMRVGVFVIPRATVRDAHGRVHYHLIQHECSGCANMRLWTRVSVRIITCASMPAAVWMCLGVYISLVPA